LLILALVAEEEQLLEGGTEIADLEKLGNQPGFYPILAPVEDSLFTRSKFLPLFSGLVYGETKAHAGD
jgi:hypothetical protein